VDLEQLATRIGPEVRRNTRQPQISFGSVSTRRLALEATTPAVLAAFEALDAKAARKQEAEEAVQATKKAKTAAATALVVRLPSEAAVRRSSPELQERKRSLRERAARARAAGDVEPYRRREDSNMLRCRHCMEKTTFARALTSYDGRQRGKSVARTGLRIGRHLS